MPYLLLAVLGLIMIPFIAAHYGAGADFIDFKALVGEKIDEYLSRFKKAYYELFVPAARKVTRFAAAFFFGGGLTGAVCAFTLRIPWWGVVLFCLGFGLLGFVCCCALLMVAREEQQQSGQVTIDVGQTSCGVQFSQMFANALVASESPVILVKPWHAATQFSVTQVTPQGFTIELDEDADEYPATSELLFNWSAQMRPQKEPLTQMAAWTFWSALAFVIAALGVGLVCHSRPFVWLSLPFSMVAILVFFQVYHVAEWALSLSADAVEYLPNTAFGFTRAILKNDPAALEEFLSHVRVESSKQALSFFHQEEWKKNRMRRYRDVLVALIPMYQWALLIPMWEVFIGWRVFELIYAGSIVLISALADRFSDEAHEKGDAELVDRADFLRAFKAKWLTGSLFFYLFLTEIVTLVVIFGMVSGDFERAFEMRTHDTWSWFLSFLRGGGSIPLPTWKIGVAAFLLGWVVYKYLLPSKEDTKAVKARAWVAYPLLVICGLIGIGGLVHAAFGKGKGDRLSISGFRRDAIAAPAVHVKWFKDGVANIEISWEKISDAVDYQFEWRKPTEKEYTVVKELAGGFGEGVTSWKGTLATDSGERFIRMRAIYRAHEEKQDGKTVTIVDDRSEPSADVTVTLEERDKPVAASSARIMPSATAPIAVASPATPPPLPPPPKPKPVPVPVVATGSPKSNLPQATTDMCKQLGIPCN